MRTARLMLYLLLSIVLMAMDQRGQYVPRIRSAMETAIEPVFHLIGLPARALRAISDYSRSYTELAAENQSLRQSRLSQSAAFQQMLALWQENRRLRGLLNATAGRSFDFRFAEMVQVNLDPFSHKVMIDRGSRDGVFVGQAVLDGSGVMGQVEDVYMHMSGVLLISDPGHALPVQIVRTGLRTVAYGTGETVQLLLPTVPQQADVRRGDLLITSGLGDRFPPGFPVAEIESIDRDTGGTFAEVRARPLAALGRGREVLLVVQKTDHPEPAAEPGQPPDATASSASANELETDS